MRVPKAQAFWLSGHASLANFEKLCCAVKHLLHPKHISVVFFSQQKSFLDLFFFVLLQVRGGEVWPSQPPCFAGKAVSLNSVEMGGSKGFRAGSSSCSLSIM